MSRTLKMISALALLGIGSAANAVVISTAKSGADGATDFAVPGWNTEIGFVAEGRIGNNSAAGTEHEVGLGPNTAGGEDRANRAWTNGAPTAFTLDFNGTGGASTFTIGDATTSYTFTSFADAFTGLALRTSTVDGSSVMFTDLSLNGDNIGAFSGSHSGGGRSVDWLLLSGMDFVSGFTLAGQVALGWDDLPARSNLAFQIKGATAPAQVPEPGPLALLGAALAAFGVVRMRRH